MKYPSVHSLADAGGIMGGWMAREFLFLIFFVCEYQSCVHGGGRQGNLWKRG